MPCNYTTVEMMEAVETSFSCNNFLTRTFFPTSRTHVAEKIEVDVRKGRRKMAPFVSPRRGGKIITREGFKTNIIRTPKVAPERILTTDDITKRSIGESVYSRDTPEERADKLLAKDLYDLTEAIGRRKEWESRQVILEGGFDVVDEEEGVDIHVDYGFEQKEVLLDDDMWSDEASDPDALLLEKSLEVLKNSGVKPNMIIGDAETIQLYLNHPKVQKKANILNIKDADIKPRVVDNNLTYYGRSASLDLDIYSFDEWFVDDETDKEEAMIPYGTIIMANAAGVGEMHYGAVTQMEEDGFRTYEAEIVPKYIIDDKNDTEIIRVTSRPVPAPKDVTSWYVLVVDQK